jgi:hypothetical protein
MTPSRRRWHRRLPLRKLGLGSDTRPAVSAMTEPAVRRSGSLASLSFDSQSARLGPADCSLRSFDCGLRHERTYGSPKRIVDQGLP